MAKKKDPMKAITEAAMRLAAENGWRSLTLNMIADEAKITLAEMRRLVDSKRDIMEHFVADVDARVLETYEQDPVDVDPRDRLFDVLMVRFELLEPHKTALRKISHDLRSDPAERLALAGTFLKSMEWMLRAADIETGGARGSLKSKGLASVYLSVAATWFEDDDPGLARTMAKLDGKLRQGETWLRNLSIPLGLGAAAMQVGATLMRRRKQSRQGGSDETASTV